MRSQRKLQAVYSNSIFENSANDVKNLAIDVQIYKNLTEICT
jgi:hypothetical protein